MTCDLTNPIFTDEKAAVAHVEASRWPNGAICPLCGSDAVHRMGGLTQAGMWLCNACRGKFTCRVGTVMERSHIAVHKWLLAIHLMSSSKKGISAHQLHRMLGMGYKSAWFMAHRIREAMAPSHPDPFGSGGKIVEADETELSPSHKTKRRPGRKNQKFVSLIERGGHVRSRRLTGKAGHMGAEIQRALWDHMAPEAMLHTDGAQHYKFTGFAHEAVDHNKEYVRKTPEGVKVHTNSAEGYFSIFKRGLVGTYQHMSPQHLPRYLAEFDFRMNNRVRLGVDDATRAARVLKGAEGKRLTYRQPIGKAC